MTELQALTNLRTKNSERLANAKNPALVRHLADLDYFLGMAILEMEAIGTPDDEFQHETGENIAVVEA